MKTNIIQFPRRRRPSSHGIQETIRRLEDVFCSTEEVASRCARAIERYRRFIGSEFVDEALSNYRAVPQGRFSALPSAQRLVLIQGELKKSNVDETVQELNERALFTGKRTPRHVARRNLCGRVIEAVLRRLLRGSYELERDVDDDVERDVLDVA